MIMENPADKKQAFEQALGVPPSYDASIAPSPASATAAATSPAPPQHLGYFPPPPLQQQQQQQQQQYPPSPQQQKPYPQPQSPYIQQQQGFMAQNYPSPAPGAPMQGQNYVQQQQPMQAQYMTGGRVQNLGQFPSACLCPNCGQNQITRVTYQAGSYTHIWALVLGLTLLLCCIPYLVDSLKDVHHYCSSCNIPLAIWHRSGGLEVLAHQQVPFHTQMQTPMQMQSLPQIQTPPQSLSPGSAPR